MFFLSFYEFDGQQQQQQKFWTLGAICDVLQEAYKGMLQKMPYPVNHTMCREVMFEMLRTKGPEVLTQLTIPKFGKIYVQLLKLDNLTVDEQGNPQRTWESAILNLTQLPESSDDPELKKLYIRFIVKTMQIFDEEVVDRNQFRDEQEISLAARIKDWFREEQGCQINYVITRMNQVLESYTMFERKTVLGTLKVLATLIDWNDVSLF